MQRLVNCNRRDAAHTSVLTRQLGWGRVSFWLELAGLLCICRLSNAGPLAMNDERPAMALNGDAELNLERCRTAELDVQVSNETNAERRSSVIVLL
jgi:hypothetical protein